MLPNATITEAEVIPSPSHPISRNIMFGIKINMFIDVINNSTVYVNRSL